MTRMPCVPADFCYPPGTISVDQATEFMLARARAPRTHESASLDSVLGRVMAQDLRSPIDVPGYDNSQMDGFALRAADAGPQGSRLPVRGRVPAGVMPPALEPGTAVRIFTGAPLPPAADTVVMQERCREEGDAVWVPGGLVVGDNVRVRGNDIRRGEVVITRGERLRPQHVGLAASLGFATLEVHPRLRVAFFSSGDELKQPGEPLGPGQIYNSNRFTIASLIRRAGAEAIDLGCVRDARGDTVRMLERAAGQADVVVSSGGVSVGEEDHVRAALEQAGELELWRIAVKPGKPLAYGRVGEADFLGLPGNPVSTFVTFCLFVRPFLFRRMGMARVAPRFWPVAAGFDWPRASARREFARARLEPNGGHGHPVATLHPRQGSDVLSSTTWADGLVEIPEGTTVAPGDTLRFLDFDSVLS